MGMKFEGLDAVIDEMTRMGEMTGAAADAMVLAGAAVVADAWRVSAKKHGHVDTGAMVDKIGYAGKVKSIGDVRAVDITSLGQVVRGTKKPRTTRNAEKAVYLSKGTRKIKASGFVREAEDAAEAPAVAAMTRVWSSYITTGKVPAAAGIRGRKGG